MLNEFWSLPSAELLSLLETSEPGLTRAEALRRLSATVSSRLVGGRGVASLSLLLRQFKSPIILILLLAAGLSFFLRDPSDALIILSIILVSALLGFWQERGAADAVQKLLAIVQVTVVALRDGRQTEVAADQVVPGDILLLSAGGSVPADCLILKSKDLFVDEAMLTGETYPAEKCSGVLSPNTPLSGRTNALFMGTHVVSGSGQALVVRTGADTEFGQVSQRLRLRPPETEFERGIRRFGYLLMQATLLLVIAIFAINVYLARPVLESFLFAMALAVGLTPQLLPAIISINLSHGAKRMAERKVIVKRLATIENFGSMNVLCADKTGTLTEGVVHLHGAFDAEGKPSEKVLRYACINACFETGFVNPIDQALKVIAGANVGGYTKLDEEPYDFVRKRLSILVADTRGPIMITKGALTSVVTVCARAETQDGVVGIESARQGILRRFEEFSLQGLRVLGIAYKEIQQATRISKQDEEDMTFLGFLIFADPPKAGVNAALRQLRDLGVTVKIITGDNRLVAASISQQVGLNGQCVLTGAELRSMSNHALLSRVNEVDVFAEVEPNQKDRIILALKKAGNVVGLIGDGINDASALHIADVGISVDSAVDVAKEAADIVLLEKDLAVLEEGVREGRRTFANTLKYVFMATSANFGNMFSMAGASLFLSFLPLLPKQILLTNLLTDIPEMTIATDSVDQEMIARPRRWDIKFIQKFMLTFGAISSVFDFATFGALLFILEADVAQFRTGWFMESVISAAAVVLIIRTRRPFFQSRPGRYLVWATVTVAVMTLLIPYLPFGSLFGFRPLPLSFFMLLAGIVGAYILAAELAKKAFYACLERGSDSIFLKKSLQHARGT
jgi:Mg2+-importing ATPase